MSTTPTVGLHRIRAAEPEKTGRAFASADAMAQRLSPNGLIWATP
jgi:hypothetical protein